MKFKKFLAGAMVGTMVLASVTGVSAADAESASTSIADLTCEGWWTDFTDGIAINENTQFTITGTTTNQSTNNWNNMIYILFSGNGTVNGDDYVEYFVGRADNYGWGTGTYEVTTAPEDWETWLAATQAGAEFTLTVTYTDGVITIISSCEDAEYTNTYTVEDTSLSYYIALSGEICTLTGMTYTDNTGFSIPNMTVLAGGSNTFDITYTPSSAIGSNMTYVSDNEHVTVEGNTVTVSEDAEDEETANITATYGDYTTTFVVTVTNTENPITTVTPSSTSIEIEVGSTATVTATYAPEDTTDSTSATWVSADESVATVNAGVITGVGAGETIVTVTIGSVSAEIAVTVTEVESESEATDDTDSSDDADSSDDTSDSSDDTDSTEESSEAVYTLVNEYDMDDTTIETWWATDSFTSSIALEEDHQYVITGTTTNNSTNNWNNVLYVLFSGDGNIYESGSDEATEAGYVEYFVGRADNYGWDSADGNTADGLALDGLSYTSVSSPEDWDTWLAATQAGAEFTITATYVDGKIQIEFVCGDVDYIVTYAVADTSLTYYISLGGEATTLSDLHVADYEVSGVVLDDTTSDDGSSTDDSSTTSDSSSTTTTTTTTTTSTTSTTGSANTGDASPIIPIAVAVLGCAAVVVASKKRMA